jgi:predicted nucleic acid-binding protein
MFMLQKLVSRYRQPRLAKLVVAEDESQSLRSFLSARGDDSLFSSALARTELIRAVAPNGAQAIADARDLLFALHTVMLTRQLLDDAGTLLPLRLRSLDAIHLVAARRAGDTLRAVITYDA